MTDEKDGVWRTVGGRRIFIKTGQSLDEAMIESGKFNKTSDKEKQSKIDSVKIDFDRDNVLPELNKEDLEELGKESKPVLLKKNIIDKNIQNHPEVDKGEYAQIIGNSLYKPDLITYGHENNPYFNFVSHIGENKNTVVLLELSESKNNYEIVNMYFARDKSRELIQKKGEKIEKRNK